MQLYDLIAKLKTIEEDTLWDGPDVSTPVPPSGSPGAGGQATRPPSGPDPRQQPVNVQTQNVKPQANRPGLLPGGDPAIWDKQQWLRTHGYPEVKTDGLRGPQTDKFYDMAKRNHDSMQNMDNPNAADYGTQAGNFIKSNITGPLQTFYRNFVSSASDNPAAPPKEESIYELAEKIRRLDEGLEIMPIMPGHAESQPDNVSMSINVNGQGEGGIRSIMNILRDIEGNDSHGEPSHEHDPKEPLIGDMVKDMNDDIENDTGEESPLSDAPEEEVEEGNENDDGETWANSAHGDAGHHVHGVDAITFSGDDMNSKGKISPVSRAPGTNSLREPSTFDESLVRRLQEHYEQIKNN